MRVGADPASGPELRPRRPMLFGRPSAAAASDDVASQDSKKIGRKRGQESPDRPHAVVPLGGACTRKNPHHDRKRRRTLRAQKIDDLIHHRNSFCRPDAFVDTWRAEGRPGLTGRRCEIAHPIQGEGVRTITTVHVRRWSRQPRMHMDVVRDRDRRDGDRCRNHPARSDLKADAIASAGEPGTTSASPPAARYPGSASLR
jgi:hypothetical protein